jgi:hypothetical protein
MTIDKHNRWLPLSSFSNTDRHNVSAILFVEGPEEGDFELSLDNVGPSIVGRGGG